MSNRYFEQDRRYGHTVWGKLFPAKTSRAMSGLPIGLAHGVMLNANIAAGQPITWNDVEIDEAAAAVKIRCEMEQRFA